MIPLTKKQAELLDYLKSCKRSPSFDEMRQALGAKSKSGVHRLVSALEERGYIRRVFNRARCIEIVEQPKLPENLVQFTNEQLASEADRRGLVLGHIYRDSYGERMFERIRAA